MPNIDVFTNPEIASEIKKIHDDAKESIKSNMNLPWGEHYRPKRVDDVILPSKIKDAVLFAIEQNAFQNMIFYSGKPGTGKSTTAKAIPEQFECDYIFLTISKQAMDVIDIIRDYSMQKSVDGKPRFVILDEADRPSVPDPMKFYQALQPVIDAASHTLRFILTCNNLYLIPDAMKSRCTPISFAHTDEAEIKKAMFARMKEIAYERVVPDGTVDLDTLKHIAKFYYPDFRAIIGAMQQCWLENKGSIIGTPNFASADLIGEIWKHIESGDDVALRQYVTANVVDYTSIYYPLSEYAIARLDKKQRLQFAVLVGEYNWRSAGFPVNQELNLNSFFARVLGIIHG